MTLLIDVLFGAVTLLVLGFFVVEVCFPVNWRTPGVWIATGLLGIPALLLVFGLVAKFPALVVLALIVAFAGNQVRKRKR